MIEGEHSPLFEKFNFCVCRNYHVSEPIVIELVWASGKQNQWLGYT